MFKNKFIINKNIKDIRIKHNLSQKDFARLLGISENYISRIENNDRFPSLEVIGNISFYLQESYENIFNGCINIDEYIKLADFIKGLDIDKKQLNIIIDCVYRDIENYTILNK